MRPFWFWNWVDRKRTGMSKAAYDELCRGIDETDEDDFVEVGRPTPTIQERSET